MVEDATHLVTRMGFVSLYMLLGNVLDLDGALYVFGLAKILLLVSTMTYLMCVLEFDYNESS